MIARPAGRPEDAPPATLEGLRRSPCDPLVLAVRCDGRPLGGLTGRVDWRLAGRLSDLVRAGAVPAERPLLLPPSPLLPVGRLILWRRGAVTPAEMARRLRGLRVEHPGLCPADFDFGVDEVRAELGGRVITYLPEPDPR